MRRFFGRKADEIDLASDKNVRKVRTLVDEFLKYVLFDVEPLFVSDETKVWDFTGDDGTETVARCSSYYGVSVSREDLDLPLWRLVTELNSRRLQVHKL
jgi:hypothetical protein